MHCFQNKSADRASMKRIMKQPPRCMSFTLTFPRLDKIFNYCKIIKIIGLARRLSGSDSTGLWTGPAHARALGDALRKYFDISGVTIHNYQRLRFYDSNLVDVSQRVWLLLFFFSNFHCIEVLFSSPQNSKTF